MSKLQTFVSSFVLLALVTLAVAEWPCDNYLDGKSHYISHEFNCSLFYECLNGDKNLRYCPTGLYYSVTTETCVYPSLSGCQSVSTFCYGVEHAYFADPYDCTKYVECYDGNSYSLTCQNGLYFSEELSVCVPPELSGCDYSDFTTPQPTAACAGISSGHIVLRAFVGDCHYFWRCIGSNPTLEQCSERMYFDESRSVCDFQNLVDCKYVNSVPPSTSSPVEQPTTVSVNDPRCANMTNITYWTHPADCTKYIECYRGLSYEMSCPQGMYFEEISSTCVDERDTQCGRTVSPSATPSGPTNAPSSDCLYEGQFLPFPGNCEKFFVCWSGGKVEEDCPDGLYWHQAIEQCDYRYLSDCR